MYLRVSEHQVEVQPWCPLELQPGWWQLRRQAPLAVEHTDDGADKGQVRQVGPLQQRVRQHKLQEYSRQQGAQGVEVQVITDP